MSAKSKVMFDVIEGGSADDLRNQICSWVEAGWKPSGSLVVTVFPAYGENPPQLFYTQAIVLELGQPEESK